MEPRVDAQCHGSLAHALRIRTSTDGVARSHLERTARPSPPNDLLISFSLLPNHQLRLASIDKVSILCCTTSRALLCNACSWSPHVKLSPSALCSAACQHQHQAKVQVQVQVKCLCQSQSQCRRPPTHSTPAACPGLGRFPQASARACKTRSLPHPVLLSANQRDSRSSPPQNPVIATRCGANSR